MLLGHYAVALAAKRVAPRTSLGTLVLAAQLLDELWPILLLAGVEHVRIVPGLMAANPLDFVSYPISHSLVMALVWGALLGATYFVRRRYARGTVVVALAVVSHWFLDLAMHRPDLQIVPGVATRVGLGGWRWIPLTIAVEGVLLAAGLAVYTRTTRARDRVGRWSLWAMLAFLVLIFASGFAGSAPPSERAIGVVTLGLWLFVPWGYWIDRHRVLRAPIAAAVNGEVTLNT